MIILFIHIPVHDVVACVNSPLEIQGSLRWNAVSPPLRSVAPTRVCKCSRNFYCPTDARSVEAEERALTLHSDGEDQGEM